MAKKPRSLVFDYDTEFAERISQHAKRDGWSVEAFNTPEAALSRAAEAPFELIALAGERAAARTSDLVRRFAEAAPGVPLLMFGAGGSTTERVAAARAGVSLYLEGRPDAASVVAEWSSALRRVSRARLPLLHIDRDATFRSQLASELVESGFEVHGMKGPASLFDKLSELTPAALILGRNLSGTGPLPLIQAIRASEDWSGLPVMILIARKDGPFAAEAYRLGADAVVRRDADPAEIGARLLGLTSRMRPRRSGHDPAVAPANDGPFSRGSGSAENSAPAEAGSTPGSGVDVTAPQHRSAAPDVILVQDDAVFLEMLEYSLSNRGLNVQSFVDGWEALAWLLAMEPRGKRPVVLLEVELPGLESLRLLRERGPHGSDDFQFIVLSVDTSEAAQILAFQCGAVDYIVKPVRIPIVLAKVQRLIDAGADR